MTTGDEPHLYDRPVLTWVRELSARDAGKRREAACCLGTVAEILPPEIAANLGMMAELLPDPVWKARHVASDVLLFLARHADYVVPRFIEAARDKDMEVRLRMAQLLVALGHQQEGLPVLIELIETCQDDLRLDALLTIDRIGPAAASAVPQLIKCLRIEANRVSRGAAWALLTILGPAAVTLFIQALREGGSEVRAAVTVVVGESGEAAKDALPALLAVLQEEMSAIARANAADAIGNILAGSGVVPDNLRTCLQDVELAVRVKVAGAIGRIDSSSSEALDFLAKVLRHPDSEIRSDALFELSRFVTEKQANLVPYLVSALGVHKEKTTPNKLAMKTLVRIGEASIDRLLQLLRGPDLEAHFWALRALLDMGKESLIGKEALLALVRKEDVYVAAAKRDPSAPRWLIDSVPRLAVEGLARLVGPDDGFMVRDFIRFLDRDEYVWEVCQAAAEGLARIGPDAKEAVPALRLLLDEPVAECQQAAAMALDKICPGK